MHKEEATNGCIFILDPLTPPYDENNTAPLNAFEPTFIKDIQTGVGASRKWDIGTLYLVDVK
jgi:hypothetical protein